MIKQVATSQINHQDLDFVEVYQGFQIRITVIDRSELVEDSCEEFYDTKTKKSYLFWKNSEIIEEKDLKEKDYLLQHWCV